MENECVVERPRSRRKSLFPGALPLVESVNINTADVLPDNDFRENRTINNATINSIKYAGIQLESTVEPPKHDCLSMNGTPHLSRNNHSTPASNMITVRRRDTKRIKTIDLNESDEFFESLMVEKTDEHSLNNISNESGQSAAHLGANNSNLFAQSLPQLNFNVDDDFDLCTLYPHDISPPPIGLLKALYEDALNAEDEEISNREAKGEDIDLSTYDQTYLNEGDILSFEKVWLPAILSQENKALKLVQAKIQRDKPHLQPVVVQCRKFLYASIGSAIEAAEKSRLERIEVNKESERIMAQQEAERLAEEEKRVKEGVEKRKQEKKELRELLRLKKLRESKKQFPQNHETWKEIAYLMTAISDLQSEEEKWNQGLLDLDRREKELDRNEKELKLQLETERSEAETNHLKTDESNELKGDESSSTAEMEEIKMLVQYLEDIVVSSNRIEQGFQIVKDVVKDTEAARKTLYQEYTQNHQFHGYQGIKNPKGLIMALSQSQDDSEW